LIIKNGISDINDVSGLFVGCSSLKESSRIPNWDLNNVFNISGLFSKCKLIKIII